jgi:hypothetical protein
MRFATAVVNEPPSSTVVIEVESSKPPHETVKILNGMRVLSGRHCLSPLASGIVRCNSSLDKV